MRIYSFIITTKDGRHTQFTVNAKHDIDAWRQVPKEVARLQRPPNNLEVRLVLLEGDITEARAHG